MRSTGLQAHARDVSLLGRSGDAALLPPSEEELVELARRHLVAEGGERLAPLQATRTYLRWKPGVSTTAAYTVACEGGGEAMIVAKRHADGKAHSLLEREERRAGEVVQSGWEPRAVLSNESLVLRVFPSDRELIGHGSLLDSRRVARLLEDSGHVPARSVRRRRTRTHLLRYKPERRSVWRVDLQLREVEQSWQGVAARVLPIDAALRVGAARATGGAIERAGIGPRLLVAEAHTGLLLEEWLDVETFGDEGLRFAREAGALLARLHGFSSFSPSLVISRVGRNSLRDLFAAAPPLWSEAERIAVPPRIEDVFVHGDLHPDQLARMRDGSGWRLLDLDCAGPGDCVRELARWVVDALRAAPGSDLSEASRELLEGYVEAGGSKPAEHILAAHVADLLVEAAAGCLRRLEESAVEKAAVLIATAATIARESKS